MIEETTHAPARPTAADEGPLAVEETAVLATLTPELRALLHPGVRFPSLAPPPPPDRWLRLSEAPPYAAYAHRALEAAAQRVEALHAGTLAYRADKAFTGREVEALGHAARVALLRDEPWLPPLLDRLLPGVAVAPTAARTLPSQALLYEIVRAGEEFPTPELVTALRTARSVTRHAGVPKQLDRALRRIEAALAQRLDVALRLPELGFDSEGVLRRPIADCTAVVRVAQGVELGWERAGKTLRSVPAAVRQAHPEQVREVRDLVKRVRAHLDTLTRALEGGLALDAAYRHDWWRAHLTDHPVARAVAGRLVWEIETAPGTWHPALPELDGPSEAPAEARVRLWHPVRADEASVESWRDRIARCELRQPFKQAFRETYRPTPAEQAGVRSERFATHLVRYDRLFALFRARGWRSALLGPWDGGDADTATRALAGGDWQVRFGHSLSEEDHELAVTGAVSFARRMQGVWHLAPLGEVPLVVFSEALRDVDLFVAVTATGADAGAEPDSDAGSRRDRSSRQAD